MKTSFIFHADYLKTFSLLSTEQSMLLLNHMCLYVQNGNREKAKLDDPMLKVAFAQIQANLDRELAKYDARAEANRLNGLKGGRPKNPSEPKKPTGLKKTQPNPKNPSEPKKADNDNGNVNDDDNVNDLFQD